MPTNPKINVPMSCGMRSLFSERKWRSRKMNIKKKKKYQKKMFYVMQKRRQMKEKRYQSLLNMFKEIQEKKTEIYDPIRHINRELEKAKFYGYKCTPIYDEFRNIINNNMNTFDDKYFRQFKDPKKPYHQLYEESILNKDDKNNAVSSIIKKK